MTQNSFEILLLLARPAAGKSETIRYLKATPLAERIRRFHIASLDEIDDFPMLWTWFEEDDLLSEMGHARLHSTPDGYFTGVHLWDLLIRRICLEYQKRLRDRPTHQNEVTTLIEFARGVEHGGWRRAFAHLSRQVAEKAAILYIDVPWEESLRKNRARFNPDRPDSILEHGLSDEKLAILYKESDWPELTGGARQGNLTIQGVQVPFVVMENTDDVTTPGGEPLGLRLETCLQELWRLYYENK